MTDIQENNYNEDKGLFHGLNVWKYDENKPFHFDMVRDQLSKYSYQEIKYAALHSKTRKLDDNIFLSMDARDFMVFPDGKAIEIFLGEYFEELHGEDKVIETTTVPAYADDDEDFLWIAPNQAIWDIKWVEDNSNRTDALSLGGKTDFYDRFGWWPHTNAAVNRETGEPLGAPLRFMGTITLNWVKGYMFNDVNYEQNENIHIPYNETDRMDRGFVIILENDLKTPEWIYQKTLTEAEQDYYINNVNYAPNVEKRIVPVDKYPMFSTGYQDDGTLGYPYNIFVIQLPIIYHGFDEYDGFYRVNEGDYGTLIVCRSTTGEYRASYQQ